MASSPAPHPLTVILAVAAIVVSIIAIRSQQSSVQRTQRPQVQPHSSKVTQEEDSGHVVLTFSTTLQNDGPASAQNVRVEPWTEIIEQPTADAPLRVGNVEHGETITLGSIAPHDAIPYHMLYSDPSDYHLSEHVWHIMNRFHGKITYEDENGHSYVNEWCYDYDGVLPFRFRGCSDIPRN
jgi:hypothetical protein